MRLARFVRGRWTLDRISYVLLAAFVLLTLGPALLGRGALLDVGGLPGLLPWVAQHGADANHARRLPRGHDQLLHAGHRPDQGRLPLRRLPHVGALRGRGYAAGLAAEPRRAEPAVAALLRDAALAGTCLRQAGRVRRGHRRHVPLPASARREPRGKCAGGHHLQHVGLHADVDQLAADPGGGVHPGPVLGAGADRPAAARSRRGDRRVVVASMLLGGFPRSPCSR